jgi:hypothetical protein
MRGLQRLFTEHPEEVGETYWSHAGTALSFAGTMFLGALACLVHAVLPFAFRSTGSRCITTLHERMVTHRCRAAMAEGSEAAETGGARAETRPETLADARAA